jgi:hypothetical protein
MDGANLALGTVTGVAWVGLAVLVGRDVHRHGSSPVWVVIWIFVFMPVALFLWYRARRASPHESA